MATTIKVHGLDGGMEMQPVGESKETKTSVTTSHASASMSVSPAQSSAAPAPAQPNTELPQYSRYPFFLKGPLFWFPYNVHAKVAQWVALQATILSLLAIIYRKERTIW
jgi:hypothetical protein